MKRALGLALTTGATALVVATMLPSGCGRLASYRASQPAIRSAVGPTFELEGSTRLLEIRARGVRRHASLLLVVDDVPRPLPFETKLDAAGPNPVLLVPLPLGLEVVTVRLELVTHAQELTIGLRVETPAQTVHTARVRLELEAPEHMFASGLGDVADLGRHEAAFVTLQPAVDVAMLGVGAAPGPILFERFAYPDGANDKVGLALESAPAALERSGSATALQLAVGSAVEVLGSMFRASGQEALRVHGTVRGPSVGAAVYATDELGATQARALVDANGAFELAVPKQVGHFFAQTARRPDAAGDEASRSSSVATFEPGVPWPLLLDLEPAGTCKVHVFDGESSRPLTARLIVRGVGETRDPWFGPDYRASGAGPIADLRDGMAEIELPAGTYKVQATHGPMYSIDEVELTVRSGLASEASLHPRRVIPGLGLLSSDLHVHARPSYDSPVQAEDRVLSLVAAGVEFAVPTEHNVVGDYESALSFTGQEKQLRFVPGVEVTTFAPKLGHFGVFPYPVDKKVPPYRGTDLGALFGFVRQDPARLLVVHHPFLGSGMGYFDRDPRFDPERGQFGSVPLGFDAIELLNGYETLNAASLERTLEAWLALVRTGHRAVGVGSSDAHRILYGWAGYPRTLIRVQDAGVPDLAALDLPAALTALRGGRAQASTGPVVELGVAGVAPGGTVALAGNPLTVHVVVRAAPWIDVTRVDVFVGGRLARTEPVDPVALRVGPETGSDDEVFARSVRFQRDLELPAPSGPSSVLVVVRGEKKLEWVLPATALPPIAITNPVWLR